MHWTTGGSWWARAWKNGHGRTTLTIAHRLTTIKDYDRILVLGEEGVQNRHPTNSCWQAGRILPPV